MSRFTPTLKEGFKLLVSIPANEPEFARAAQEEGADAIKIHINMLHPASKVNFGSWPEEKAGLKKILDAVSIPVGIVPGAEVIPTPEEMLEILEFGFDFVDMFVHYFPAYLLACKQTGKMVAVNEVNPLQLKEIKSLVIEAIETSVVPRELYHTPLTAKDLLNYKIIAQETGLPILVPTQKKILPREVEFLKAAGARGIVIGAVVTGNDLKGFAWMVQNFRRAIDELK